MSETAADVVIEVPECAFAGGFAHDECKTRVYVGIDPGLTGAIAFLQAEVKVGGEGAETFMCCVHDIPTEESSKKGTVKRRVNARELADLIDDHCGLVDEHSCFALEKTTAMPGQGVASMFSMGDTFGVCRAVIETLGYDVDLIPPGVWKREMELSSDKKASIARALALFPHMANDLSRAKDHNRAEALLLAAWNCERNDRS